MSKKGIAVFDLDGTITSKDTFLEFIKFSKGSFKYYVGLLVMLPFIVLFYLKILSNHRLKELFFTYFYKGKSIVELQKQGTIFCEKVLPNFVYKNALQTFEFHRKNNHEIVVLTASSPIWLKPWCDSQKCRIIGTEFETKNGKITGKILGKNCYGIQKKILLEPIMQHYDYEQSFGYGDSKADEYFFSLLKNTYFGSLEQFSSTES